MTHYLEVFTLNWAVESLVAIAILRPAGARYWMRLLTVELILNLATHPLLWFGLPRLSGDYLRNLIAAEALVVSIEIALGIRLLGALASRGRLATAIFAANLVTFLLTFLL